MADKVGRLKSLQVGCIWAILGCALQASAQNISWMALARVIGGIGCGHLNTIVPIWTSELADSSARGTFVAVEFTLALTGGTMSVSLHLEENNIADILLDNRVYWTEYECLKTQSLSFA